MHVSLSFTIIMCDEADNYRKKNLPATFTLRQTAKHVSSGVRAQLVAGITGCCVQDVTKLDESIYSCSLTYQ